ncbi:hypothetical protein HDU97_005832 [Phlyctochytrium planicorne]|nr:hypothetical protein HDU97_005832 [Phlyctochytrium planicorne]
MMGLRTPNKNSNATAASSMEVDDNDPHVLLSTLLTHMDPKEELEIVADIRKALVATEKNRMKNSNDAMDTLRALTHLEEQKRQLSTELLMIQEQEDEEYSKPPDVYGLKLQIYSNLGITPVREEDGSIHKCLTKSLMKNDFITHEISNKSFSDFYHANVLWEFSSS